MAENSSTPSAPSAADRGASAMRLVAGQRTALESTIAQDASAIIADATGKYARGFFSGARGVYLETEPKSAARKGAADEWARITRALWGHFDRAGLRAVWPNIRSGEGEFVLRPVADAARAAQEKSAAREQADAQALAEHRNAQEAKRVQALQALGPADMTAHLLQELAQWSPDHASQAAVVAALASEMERRTLALADQLAKRERSAAKAAAKRASKRAEQAAA